jgi:hypothetical protein
VEACRTPLADAWNLSPPFWSCVDDGLDGSEVTEKRACQRRRQSWDCGENRFGCLRRVTFLRPLGVDRSIGAPSRLLRTDCEAIEPLCRLVGIDGTNNADSLFHRGETRATDCVSCQWATVKIVALYKEIWPPTRSAKATELPPETSPYQCAVEIQHLFAFDQHAAADFVIGDLERGDADFSAELGKQVDNAADALMNVDANDNHRGLSLPPPSARRQRPARTGP